MLRFLTYFQVTPQLKRQVKITSVVCAGLLLGYCKGFIVNQQYQNINSSKLTTYQSQDQINSLIQQRKQPAVIYYYLPMNRQHAFFRLMMFKYSNLYEKDAIFAMVNLTKKFQQARGSMDLEYPTRVRLQVRHPKSQVAIKVGQEGSFFQLKEKAFRRDPFKFNYTDEGFKKFLEDNRIIESVDPVKRVLNLTSKALFQKPQQIQTS